MISIAEDNDAYVSQIDPPLSIDEAAWLAGFIDGEGCLQIQMTNSKRDRHVRSTTCTISISQAEPRTDVLYWLRDRIGGTVNSHGTHLRNPKHNKSYSWSISGANVSAVCDAILPYLKLKKRQAELLIENQATKLSSHMGTRKGTKRDSLRITPEIISLREAQHAELKALNKRGVGSAASINTTLGMP